MNRYATIAREQHRRTRPREHTQIQNPEAFFSEIGEQIQAEIAARRDEILGPIRPGEDPETYRLRSYQALTTAEELVLADHHLFQPEPSRTTDEDWSDDPDLARSYRTLDEINQAINTPL